MRFLRVGDRGHERPAVQDGEVVFDISSMTEDIDGTFLAGSGIQRVRDAVRSGSLPRLDITDQRLGPPVSRPAAVLWIGQNYGAHAAESGDPAPKYPIVFFNHPTPGVAPSSDIRRPPGAQKLDWE